MNWIQSLYETYENCQNMIGVVGDEKEVPLLPICHTTQKAQIEITLDANGNFRRARVLDKDEARTIIPCTEKSAGRTSGESAHPLCDKLQYVAGDYADYLPDANEWDLWLAINKLQDANIDYKKSIENRCSYFGSYENLLSEWVNHGAPEPVRIIHQYIQKRKVVSDLIASQILFSDETHKFCFQRPFEKSKNASTDIFDLLPGRINTNNRKIESWQADAFVRWRVEIGDDLAEVWKDPAVIQSWIDYYSSTKTTKSLCYVTGIECFTADQHPAKIRNDGDKAKLISSNDTSGFTFRGRFIYDIECVSVSFTATQKAHSAFRWLMSRQGYVKDDLGVVAWAVSGAKAPQPTADTYAAIYDAEEESDIADTAQDMAIRLKKKIAGYRQEIGEREDVVVMAVDSATPGRLSIVYYRVLKGSEFLERIENWHETCAWRHTYHLVERQDEKGKTRKISVPFYGAPAPADIAEAAYGSRLDDKLKKATIKRLLPCIVDGRPIPRDLVEAAVRRASNRAGISGYDWSKTLTIACAMYRKYTHGKENFDMSLDETRKTRDYLFGRLLAIADVLEERTLSEAEKNRPTNATRYMQQFSQRPFSTWKQIHELLTPYFMRQGDNASYYKWLIAQVEDLFAPEDFISNKPLTGEYLLGYYCQRQKMWEKKEKPASEEIGNANSK
ncbi:MAG: type I-C CRISPR-associated protein Cas8c/Csd1 [Chloroflexota bacterium]